MPKLTLSTDQVGELIDLVTEEIGTLSISLQAYREDDPDYVEWKHRESVLLEILEVLEDA